MSKLLCWIKAIRPQTLFVSISSVMLATAAAMQVTDIEWLPACLCLVFAILAQITSNLANDYADFINGSDKNRIGPPRMTSSGLISPRAIYYATVLCAILAFFTGLPLIWWGGWWLLIPGIIIIISAIAYSSGPFPFSYHYLGDIAVIVFFGIIPVSFTFYILTETFNYRILLEGLLLGLIINELLIVNNYRDYRQDKAAGKRTTIVIFGRRFGRVMYLVNGIIALALVLPFLFLASLPFILLFALFFTLFIKTWQDLRHREGKALNKTLGDTARNVLLFALLLSAFIVLS